MKRLGMIVGLVAAGLGYYLGQRSSQPDIYNFTVINNEGESNE